MAAKIRMVTDEEAEFLSWVSHAPTVVLECRIGMHRFPGITDKSVGVKLGKQGRVQLEALCQRDVDGEGCGTLLRKMLGADGVLERAVSAYEHDSDYALPAGVTEGSHHQLSRGQRGTIRKELLRRKAESQDAAERLAARKSHRPYPRASKPKAGQVKFIAG